MSTPQISILIVDDSPALRHVLKLGLEEFGYTCRVAQHGLEALNMLQTVRCDVVVTDLQMPCMDGMELVRHLTQNPVLGNPIIIMMTGSIIDFIRPVALQLGVIEILEKPCLAGNIHHLLKAHPHQFPDAA